jgi:hypothetical protein
VQGTKQAAGRAFSSRVVELALSSYELPNLGAVNFVVRGLLGTGATSTLRLDSQAKALSEWLLSRSTKAPRSLVTT